MKNLQNIAKTHNDDIHKPALPAVERGPEYCNPLNIARFDRLSHLTHHNHWRTHILDHLIYRCQNSKLSKDKLPMTTDKLASLAAFTHSKSVSMFRKEVKALATLGLVQWNTCYTDYGNQTFISLTDKLMAELKQQKQIESIARLKRDGVLPDTGEGGQPQDDSPCFMQAINQYRYQAIGQLLTNMTGRSRFFCQYILNQLMIAAQYQAQSDGASVDSTYVVINQVKLAQKLHISVRTLQRYLRLLERDGLVTKKKRKVTYCKVETAYKIAEITLVAARRANQTMARNKQHALQNAANDSQTFTSPQAAKKIGDCHPKPDHHNTSPPHDALFGGSNGALFGGSNYIYNKNSNINIKHSTSDVDQELGNGGAVCLKNRGDAGKTGEIDLNTLDTVQEAANVACSPPEELVSSCQVPIDLSHSTGSQRQPFRAKGANFPLDTTINENTQLNQRQLSYLSGMLSNLTTQHGCLFSDPKGLKNEIIFSLKAVGYAFVGRTGFLERVNIIGKLLKHNRWTTPKGYERYDAKGRAQKAKREVRERTWAEKKSLTEQGDQRRGNILPISQALPTVRSHRSPPDIALTASISERINDMQKLAERAAETDCTPEVKAAIKQQMLRHQNEIKQMMAKPKARQ